MKGDFDLFGKAENLFNNVDLITDGSSGNESYFDQKERFIKNFKKVILLIIHGASRHFDKNLVHEQEVMNNLSDMIMETYVSESVMLRVGKMENLKGSDVSSIYKEILNIKVYDASARIRKSAYDAVNSFAEDELAGRLLRAVDVLTTVSGVNVKEARRKIADKLIEDNSYRF
jgi:hypothetical protein